MGVDEAWGGARVRGRKKGEGGTRNKDLILDFSSHYRKMVHFQFCISRTKRLSDDLFKFSLDQCLSLAEMYVFQYLKA